MPGFIVRITKTIYFFLCFFIELSATITVGVQRVMHDFYKGYGIDSSEAVFITEQAAAGTELKDLIFNSKIVLENDLIESIKSTGKVQEAYTHNLLYKFGLIECCKKKRFGPIVGVTSFICAGSLLASMVSFAGAGIEIAKYIDPPYTIEMYDVYKNNHGEVVLKLYNHNATLRERAAEALKRLENSKYFAKIGGSLLASAALALCMIVLIDNLVNYSDLEEQAEQFVQKILVETAQKI